MRTRRSIVGGVVLSGAALIGSSGCTVQTAPPAKQPEVVVVEEVRAERVAKLPPRIERYPQTTYRGRPAYLVGDRWYYRSADRGWVVLREEPKELARYRVRTHAEKKPAVIVIEGVRAERIQTPPRGWRDAPRTRYRGADAYFVDDQWYYHSPDRGWVILREEPVELGRYRRERVAPGAHVRVHGVAAERTRKPAQLDRFTRVPYRGTDAYLIDGQWYIRTDDGWVILREEPRELSRVRIRHGGAPAYTPERRPQRERD